MVILISFDKFCPKLGVCLLYDIYNALAKLVPNCINIKMLNSIPLKSHNE